MPPIRQRPPGLMSPDEPDEMPDGDTLLFDHRPPGTRRAGSRRVSSGRPGSRRASPGRSGRRPMAIVVPVIVVVAVAALALALLTGHGLKFGPLTSDQNKTPKTTAPRLPLGTVAFDTYPGQQQRGVFQVINRIVAVGSTMVTTGSQSSDGVVRQQFLVSANAGASWHLAPVQAPGGGQAALGHPATLLAGGPGGWVAVGPQAIWTSPTGLTWTLAATHGITPEQPGDVVLGDQQDRHRLPGRRHGAGPGAGQHTGVIWTSRNGLTWQRATAEQLGLTRPGETVQSISYITSRGNATVISGAVVSKTGAYSAAWLSTNRGTSWTRLNIPADHGSGSTISGLGSDGSGLIAVRPGRTATGAANGVTYFSPDGRTWQYAGTIDPDPKTGGWTPSVVKGSSYGFVVTGTTAEGQLVAYTSTGTGTSWLPTGPLGNASVASVSRRDRRPGRHCRRDRGHRRQQDQPATGLPGGGHRRHGPVGLAGRHRRGHPPRDEDQQHRRGGRPADRGRQRQRLPGGVAANLGPRLDPGLLPRTGRGRPPPARADQRDARPGPGSPWARRDRSC